MNKTIEAPSVRTVPLIRPDQVSLNSSGFCWRSWAVRLPAGLIADDLKESVIWSEVQRNPGKALRDMDELTLIAHDRSWYAECRVMSASGEQVTLGKPRIQICADRFERLFSDGTYRVVWTGSGYAVEKIATGQQVGSSYANAALAERELMNQYPKR